jgi:hypothetical protein
MIAELGLKSKLLNPRALRILPIVAPEFDNIQGVPLRFPHLQHGESVIAQVGIGIGIGHVIKLLSCDDLSDMQQVWFDHQYGIYTQLLWFSAHVQDLNFAS